MKNLTIRVDDQALKAARVRALEEGTSVNEVLRRALEDYAYADERARDALQALVESAEQVKVSTAGKRWSRDELHDR